MLPAALTPLLLVGWHLYPRLGRLGRGAYRAGLAVVILAFGGLCAARAYSNTVRPPAWDIQMFWLYGRTATDRESVYSSEALYRTAEQVVREDPLLLHTENFMDRADFRQLVLDVGIPYPPPSTALLAFPGALDLGGFARVWYALLILELAASIVLLWRTFFPGQSGLALAFTAALVLTLRGTYSTFAFGQINFLLLLMLVLYWRHRGATAGVFGGLASAVKPIGALAIGHALLRRRWRSLAGAAASLAVLTLVTGVLFGLQNLTGFFTSSPFARMPHWTFITPLESSLMTTLLRMTAAPGSEYGSPSVLPVVLLLSAVVTIVTVWLMVRLDDSFDDLALALLIPAAFLLYPHTLEYYNVVFILPVLYIWTKQEALGLDVVKATVLLTATYALVRLESGDWLVAATTLLWVALAAMARRAIVRTGHGTASAVRTRAGAVPAEHSP